MRKQRKTEKEGIPVALYMLEECLINQVPIISEDENECNENCVTFTQGMSYDRVNMSTTYTTIEQPIVEIGEIPLSHNNLRDVSSDKKVLCDTSLISMPQLVNEHVSSIVEIPCVEFKHACYSHC